MAGLYFDNAIAWAQFKLHGGLRGMLVVGGGFALIAGVGILLLYEAASSPTDKTDAMRAVGVLMMLGAALFLRAMGGFAVSGAIRQDLVTRRIESHRLMPLSPLAAIVGYLVGAPIRGIMLAVLCMAIALAVGRGGFTIQTFYLFNISLVVSSLLMLWSVLALGAFISRGVIWVMLVFFFLSFNTGFTLYEIVPALPVLAGLRIWLAFLRGFGPGPSIAIDQEWLFVVGAQLIVALLCIMAAARKYERGDVRGLPIWYTLGFFLIWIAASAFQIKVPPAYNQFIFYRQDPYETSTQLSGALVTSLVVAAVVMSSIAYRDVAAENKNFANEIYTWRFSPLLLFFVLLCAGMVAGLTFLSATIDYFNFQSQQMVHFRQNFAGRHWQAIACISAIFLFQAYILMRMAYDRWKRPNFGVCGILAALVFLPMAIDLIYYSIETPNRDPKADYFSLASPLGGIIQAMADPTPPGLWLGIAVQLALLVMLIAVYSLIRRRRVAKAKRGVLPPISTVEMPEIISASEA